MIGRDPAVAKNLHFGDYVNLSIELDLNLNDIANIACIPFSLLPPENATGNWVKVVQRVPVKILLEDKTVGNPHPLRAGMSAYVTVRTR